MTSREHDMTTNDDRFDHAMRDLHAQAVSQVSSATRARLRVARHAAARPSGERAPRRWLGGNAGNWVLGSGLAAVFAVAIGLQLRPAQTPAPAASAPPAIASVTPDSTSFDAGTAVAALDENPDLYLWLASNDDAVPSLEP